jgi:WD40 repeat protein/energy-coupling factor transporter ATP-binding protein EcfA2
LVTAIDQWQSAYRSFGQSARIKAKKIVYGGSIVQWREDCHKSAADLRSRLNNWLLSESFRPLRERWLQQLSSSDEVRVLIRTSSVSLRKLPWHLWDLVENYAKAEVAYCAPESEQSALSKTPTYRDKVRILAILGNSTGINVLKDRQLLENLPDAATTFLVEPQRQDINDQLWNQAWDILFFAGHSKTEGNTGRIYINQTDSLTIAELRYGLSNAVANGLQLAIFNSCDGLGLALELEQLHIGQMIVMREPVPDQVAQSFLTYFLAEFAGGKSFYLAERKARLKLHGLEDNFPCASWLPAIFQNPAAVPPMWQDLGRRPTDVCPYRGLFAFREEDAPFFYGRDAFTQMLVEAVQKQSLVAVIGPSGSGKSSVVFAGLIPQLRSERTWLIEAFRPGDRPFRNLAAKLVPLLETQMSETDQLLEINKLATALRQGDLRLRDAIARILEKNSGERLLLVADQFEELYTLCRDARERLLFLDNLLEASEHTPNFTLVLTLRADFLGQALSYRPFGDALQYADLKLSPMNREELQAAVEQPAAMLGVTIESGLTERILDAVSTQPGDLPLLEFALNQLWAKQRDAQLTHAAYEEIGGVEAALSRYAEEAYGRLNEEEKERARRIFIQLVRPGEGTEDTRRLATRIEVGEENWDLVTRLACARLVVSSRDEALGEETVEIVHEALIGGWERLRLWIELDRNFRTWQERLRASLRQWEASGRDEGALLRGAPLAEAESWLKLRPVELSPAERVFIQLSLELRDRERKERERRWQRTIFGLAGGLGVVSILAVGAFWQWQQAEKRRTNAELNSLSERSQVLFNSDNRVDALIASLIAGIKLKRTIWAEADTRTQVVAKLQQAVYGVRKIKTLEGHNALVRRVSFSPDGKTLVSASDDGIVKLWNLEGKELQTLKGHNDWVYRVSFSPDSKTFASASADKTIKLWNLQGKLLQTLRGHGEAVTSVVFSPDGKTIASASADKTIKLWNLQGKLLQTLRGHGEAVTSVVFSPDGKTIASASADKTIKLWNLEGIELQTFKGHSALKTIKLWNLEGRELQTFKGYSALVSSVSFSPDGKTIAGLSPNNTVKLWNIEGRELQAFKGHNAPVRSVSFSPDGKMIASASGDQTIKLWNLEGRELQTFKGDSVLVSSISFSPDGKTLASGSDDGTVKLWNLEGRELQTLKGHTAGHSALVSSISFSSDGKTLASGSDDGTVKLWNLEGRELQTFKGLSNLVISVSFSADGKTIAAASTDGTVKVWNLEGRELQTFKWHKTPPIYVSFSADGKTIATLHANNTVKLWNLEGRELQTVKVTTIGAANPVISVSFSPDGKTIAVLFANSSVTLWNLENGLLQYLKRNDKRHSTTAYSVSFSPDAKTLASISPDSTVKLWNLEGRELQTFKGHNAPVRSVSFSPDGKTIASASDDGTVKLWNLEGRELRTFKGHSASVLSISFSPDGKTIASASAEVILWNLDLEDLLVRGCGWLSDYVENNPDVGEPILRTLFDSRSYQCPG